MDRIDMKDVMEMGPGYSVYIKNNLKKTVIGQEDYINALSASVSNFIRFGDNKPVILVVGPTGSGKTFAIMEIERQGLIPEPFTFFYNDVSSITETGFTGDSVDGIIKGYLDKCEREDNTEARGIIFLDEFDKKVCASYDSNGTNNNAHVMGEMLNLISGKKTVSLEKRSHPFSTQTEFDSSKVMFILAGAFTELDALESERMKTPLGFERAKESKAFDGIDYDLKHKLIEIGCIPELVGRITACVRLKKLTRKQLKALFLFPDNGYLDQKKKQLRRNNIDLEISREAIEYIVDFALREDTGARSIQSVLDTILLPAELNAIEQEANIRLELENERVEVKYEGRTKNI